MNLRDAKTFVLRGLAAAARAEIDNGSPYLFPEGQSLADYVRVKRSVLEVADELDRRAERAERAAKGGA